MFQIRLNLFGEQQERTADSFYGLALTPPSLGDWEAITESRLKWEKPKQFLTKRSGLLIIKREL